MIVTANVRDFPAEILTPFEIEAQHPDEFVSHLLDLSPGVVLEAARRHRESLKKPAETIEGLTMTHSTCPPAVVPVELVPPLPLFSSKTMISRPSPPGWK